MDCYEYPEEGKEGYDTTPIVFGAKEYVRKWKEKNGIEIFSRDFWDVRNDVLNRKVLTIEKGMNNLINNELFGKEEPEVPDPYVMRNIVYFATIPGKDTGDRHYGSFSRIVGFLFTSEAEDQYRRSYTGIDYLYVSLDHRGKKIASLLMLYAMLTFPYEPVFIYIAQVEEIYTKLGFIDMTKVDQLRKNNNLPVLIVKTKWGNVVTDNEFRNWEMISLCGYLFLTPKKVKDILGSKEDDGEEMNVGEEMIRTLKLQRIIKEM